MPDGLTIRFGTAAPLSAMRYAAADPEAPVLALAHGAGAGQRSPFMSAFAEALRARGVTTVTFDFPYMQLGRRAPDRAPVLEAAWRAVVEGITVSLTADTAGSTVRLKADTTGGSRLVIGGKSMGGRIASQVLADLAHPLPVVRGLVLLGYPLHPPGQPDRPRVAHLPHLATPTLVVQGSRDPFGTEQEVREAFAAVPAPVDWLIVPGGDHSFKPPRAGGQTGREVLALIYDAVAAFVHTRRPPAFSP
jgi:predicted alpha/beta-hydrolase family hydrolase